MGYKVFISHVKTFGYIMYTNIPKETHSKLELVTRKIILVKYILISR